MSGAVVSTPALTGITSGTAAPSGGKDGDQYKQVDGSGNTVALWWKSGGAWGQVLGSPVDGSVPQRTVSRGVRRRTSRPGSALDETMPRWAATTNSASGPASGTVRMSLLEHPLVDGETVTSIGVVSGAQAGAGLTVQRFGLYDMSLNLLAKTVDDGSTAWAASTMKVLSLMSPYTPSGDTPAYLAVLVVATTLPGAIFCPTLGVGAVALNPVMAGNSSTGVTDLPATAAAITAGGPLYACIF